MNETQKNLYQIGETTREIMDFYREKRGTIAILLTDNPQMPPEGREYCRLAMAALEELYQWRFRWADVFHKFMEDAKDADEVFSEEVNHAG
jgi:hypothetical protein